MGELLDVVGIAFDDQGINVHVSIARSSGVGRDVALGVDATDRDAWVALGFHPDCLNRFLHGQGIYQMRV